MIPIELYPAFKQTHIALAGVSVLLFTARGAGVLAGGHWPMTPWLRGASVAIDTLLLGAGVSMWAMLSLHPTRDRWLGAKLILIVLYIVLGSLALKRAPSRAAKAVAFAAALACIGTIAAIALTHDAGVLGRIFVPTH